MARAVIPFVIGGAAIVGWTAFAGWSEPSPGALSSPHARLGGDGSRCADCHGPDGLTAACLDCHEEIQNQWSSGEGYHGWMREQGEDRCDGCHGEHYGREFPLISHVSWDRASADGFSHEFTDFSLHGAHAELPCEECHRIEWRDDLATLTERPGSMLGLDQACLRCHQDVHGTGARATATMLDRADATANTTDSEDLQGSWERCTDCHGQEHFRPVEHFDHSRSFELVGAHTELACEQCHHALAGESTASEIAFLRSLDPPAPKLDFRRSGGQRCEDCHTSPHDGANETMYGEDCARCHDPQTFEQNHYDRGAHTAFALQGAHTGLDCAACHQTLECRLEGVTPSSCAICHTDPHAASLANRDHAAAITLFETEECSRCHSDDSWHAEEFARTRHAELGMPLADGHGNVDCVHCHRPSMQPTTSGDDCADCHESPHSVPFTQDCSTCHLTDHRTVRLGFARMDGPSHAQTGFPLTAPHADVACESCHADANSGQNFAARFPGRRAEQCADCHHDPHGGQFGERSQSCTACHDSTHFLPPRYDVADHTRFPLLGNHLAVACDRCHTLDPDDGVRRFVGTSQRCADCHENPHGDQFAREMQVGGCAACHDSFVTWGTPPFDHDQTQFPLRGAHTRADCTDCHRPEEVEAGAEGGVRRFRGRSRSCADCHEDPHRGQLVGEGRGDCNRCHTSVERWSEWTFDHDRQSRFLLEGVHRDLDCRECHSVEQDEGHSFVRYRPLGTECRDCHDVR